MKKTLRAENKVTVRSTPKDTSLRLPNTILKCPECYSLLSVIEDISPCERRDIFYQCYDCERKYIFYKGSLV